MKGEACAKCNELIVVATTVKGEPLAINAGAVASGTIALEHRLQNISPIAHLAPNIPADRCSAIRFVAHLPTCTPRLP